MAKQGKSRAKKKKPMNPTVKAGFLVFIVLGLIWGTLSGSEPWYQKIEETKPISMAGEVTVAETQAPAVTEKTEVVTEAVTVATTVSEIPETTTQSPTNNAMSEQFDASLDLSQLDTKSIGWSFKRNTEHLPVVGYNQGVDLGFYDAFYIVPTEEKVLYLTFDEGYENGFSDRILDTLRDNDVQAAFFVTEAYIRNSTDLVKRMKEEGHIVGNHSVTHPKMSELSYEEAVQEIKGTATSMETNTGYTMDLFFRPPEGNFSEQSLYITRQQGYKTIFWSMAYQDWNVDNQPGAQASYEHVTSNAHPGAIILLHAVSQSNTEALDRIIKELKSEGYRFGSLYEIESKYTME